MITTSYFLLSNRRDQFLVVSQNIYKCQSRIWRQILSYGQIFFYGHFLRTFFFRTVSDSCLKVTFISGGENHKSHDIFLYIFHFHQAFSMALWLFWDSEKYNKKQLKTNLWGTNFPEFCAFWLIWRQSISKTFFLQGSFTKVDTCKEIFSN